MDSSPSLDSIPESDSLTSDDSSSEDYQTKDPGDLDECKRKVDAVLNHGGFMNMSKEMISEAVKRLKDHNAIDRHKIHKVTLHIIQQYISKKDFPPVIEELDNVIVFEADFFSRIEDVKKKFGQDAKLQIIEAISVRMEETELEARHTHTICRTCFSFISFIRGCLKPDTKNPIITGAAERIVLTLYEGYLLGKERMIVDDRENLLDNVLQYVDKLNRDGTTTVAKPHVVHKIIFLKAALVVVKHKKDCKMINEVITNIGKLLEETKDERFRNLCNDVLVKGRDQLTVLDHRSGAQPEDAASASSETNQRKKNKKKKRKNGRSSSAGPQMRDQANGEVSNENEQPVSDTDTVIGSDTASQTSSQQAAAADDGSSNDVIMEQLQFLEQFQMKFCNPLYSEVQLKDKKLEKKSNDGKSIAEALWSVMSPLVHSRPDWHLRNIPYEEFHSRLERLVEKVDASIIEDHRLLRYVADHFLVRIEVISSIYPLVHNTCVQPREKNHESTIHLLHVSGKKYVGLTEKMIHSTKNISAGDAVIWDGIPDLAKNKGNDDRRPAKDVSKEMNRLLKKLSWLSKFQTKDSFEAGNTSGGKAKPKYEPKDKPQELLQKEPNLYKRCVLHLEGPHEGFATPCTESMKNQKKRQKAERENIPLRGRRNCGMAFEGDIVVVRVFKDNKGAINGGRVVGVLESAVRPVYQIFFCKVCRDQTTLMKPICGTVPKIHVANDQAEEEYMRTSLEAAKLIYDYGHQQGSYTDVQKDRATKNYANKCMVTLYDVEEQQRQVKFKFRKVEKIQRLTCENIFVVVYKRWNPYYLYPYGHVVAMIEPTCSVEDELAIMRLQWQLPHPYKDEKNAISEAEAIRKQKDDDNDKRRREDFRDVLTFTIDNDDTTDMDDAISMRVNGNVMEIGVHITDVTNYVRHNSFLDRAARERALTVYGIPSTTTPVHMLPERISTARLSLLEGENRLCLSVIMQFDMEKKEILRNTGNESNGIIKTMIRSDRRLTKQEVTDMLRKPKSTPVPAGESPVLTEITKGLSVLFECIMKMRKERLEEAAYYHDSSWEDLPEVGSTIEASILVEELMVEANCRVARYLRKKFPAHVLLRVHSPPDDADVEDWLAIHRQRVRHSGKLIRELKLQKIDSSRYYSENLLYLSSDVVDKVKAAFKQKDFDTPFRILSAEKLHPSLLLAIGEWHSIGKFAEYQRAAGENSPIPGGGQSHFSLNTESYVHFTSPLRRYNDIVIHRLVHAALDGRRAPMSELEIDEIAKTCCEMRRRVKSYEKSLELYQLHKRTQKAPLYLPCVVSDVTSPRIVLNHRMISRLPLSARSFTHGQLTLEENPIIQFDGQTGSAPSSIRCTWKQRLFIVNPGTRNGHPNLREPVSERRQVFSVQSVERQYYITRNGNKYKVPLYSILRTYPGRQWDSFWNGCKFSKVEADDEKVADITSEIRELTNPDEEPTSRNPSPAKTRRIVLDPAVKFSHVLKVQRAVRAQFMGPPVRTARMRSPKLQYLHLCPSFGICLEHRDNPVHCFGDFVGDVIEEVKEFDDVDEYQATWLPVLRMESITESMMDENSYHLRDVEIMWMCDGQKMGGLFCLDEKFCMDPYRQIRISSEGELQDCLTDIGSHIDFLCIRIQVDNFCWIAHAGVRYMTSTGPKNVIYFVVHQQAAPMPPEIITDSKLASVEVIVKTMPKRRQEKAVEMLSNVPDTTAVKIALGDFVSGGGLTCQMDYVSNIFKANFRDLHLHTAKCNNFQRRAIENSFKWPISLIWGPPGTGKTITGVQITFWYVKFNRLLNLKNPPPSATTDNNQQGHLRRESNEEEQHSDNQEATPQEQYPEVWKDFQIQGKRKRRRMNTNSSTITDDSGFCRDDILDNKLLEWIDFPSVNTDQLYSDIPLESRRRQVLYCGPSNDCVNCVAEHLRTKIEGDCMSLVRVFSEQVELNEFSIPGEDASFSRLTTQVQVPENLLEISLHRLIRNDGKPFASQLKDFDAAFKRVFIYLDGKADIPKASISQHKEVLNKLRRSSRDYHMILSAAKSLELRRHDVVLCTSAVSASLLVQHNCRFTQVIIDEAGMCTEAETLVPLVPMDEEKSASSAIENVVLIGDHKQLRPILRSQLAAELGLERSMLQRHWTAGIRKKQMNRTMLQIQYRMHPSICEFPSSRIYGHCLKTGVSQLWSGLGEDDVYWRDEYSNEPRWTGLNPEFAAKWFYKSVLKNGNANVLEHYWPGINYNGFKCMRGADVHPQRGEEERVVFLHVEGREESLTLTTEEGNENSKCNSIEADEVVRMYMELRNRFSQPRNALNSIAVLSQYKHQVNVLRERLTKEVKKATDKRRMSTLFENKNDQFRKTPVPIVSSVVRSQGSEFDYVILSTVRSLPEYDIDPNPTPGWEKKYLGFITDINQVNVAITRARRGLIIIGNGKLLRVHKFWNDFLSDLENRGCYVKNSTEFPLQRKQRNRKRMMGAYIPARSRNN